MYYLQLSYHQQNMKYHENFWAIPEFAVLHKTDKWVSGSSQGRIFEATKKLTMKFRVTIDYVDTTIMSNKNEPNTLDPKDEYDLVMLLLLLTY